MSSTPSNSIAALAETLSPINLVGDALTAFGLDKPAESTNPAPVIQRHIQYHSNTRNIENMEKLQMDPAQQDMCDREHFATRISETNIKGLCTRPTFLDTFRWKTGDAASTILYSVPVGPLATMESNATIEKPTEQPLMDYISNFAKYWRGGMVYTFQIVSSAFHEGRLDITSHPTVQSPPSSYSASMSQYNASFVLRNTNNVFSVLVPFESDVPWKKVYRGQDLSDTRGEKLKFTDFFIGSLAVRVSVPLKATDVVVPFVDVNIFVSGAQDYQ